MIERDFYIAQLENFIDKPFVKIITGIRRSGKSSILILFKERLIAKGSYDCQSGKNPSRLGRQMLHKIDSCRQPVDHASACQRRLVVRAAPVRHVHNSVFSGNTKINQLCSKKHRQHEDVFHNSLFFHAGDPAITN
jgi:hypothetical protein